jgi:hypothetical protein
MNLTLADLFRNASVFRYADVMKNIFRVRRVPMVAGVLRKQLYFFKMASIVP